MNSKISSLEAPSTASAAEIKESHENRKIGLDIARVAAVSLVLISHFAHRLQFVGIFGVELFFALSGYLIGRILYKNLLATQKWSMSDVTNFWVRRWWRTIPNYYLFLLVSLAFHYWSGGLPTPAGFMPFLVFSQNLMDGTNGFYGVSWSLAIEEWFYLLFPLAILLFTLLGMGKRKAFLFTTIVFLVVPPMLREFALASQPPEQVRLMTLPRLDAIFYGVAMAFFLSRIGMTKRMRLACVVLGALIVSAFFVLFLRGMDPQIVYRGAFFLLPLGFTLCLPWFESMPSFSGKWPVFSNSIYSLSLWSYSIYLSHIPVLFTVYALFGSSRESGAINLLSKVVGLALCILISKIIFEKFESPLTAMRPATRIANPASRNGRP